MVKDSKSFNPDEIRQYAIDNFSPEVFSKNIEAVYQKCLDQSK